MKHFVSVCLLACALPWVARADGTVIASLPPGHWFRSAHYEGELLTTHNPTPTIAAITGEYRVATDAERAARGVDRTRVGPGFPWVVANHDLRIDRVCNDEIVVVAGLFASRRDARAWQAADATRASLRLVRLEDEAHAHCPRGYGVHPSGAIEELVHIEPTRDAPAYSLSDMQRIGELAATDGSDAVERYEATMVPRCTIPRGSVFAFAPGEAPFAGWRYVAARCGSEVVFVRSDHTMVGTFFETTANGTRLLQVVDVQCDTPTTAAWSYTIEGGRGDQVIPPTTEGCGDP